MARGTEIRQFGTGRPVLRISNASTHATERTVVWDELNNEFHLNDYNWMPHNQAPPTEVEGGDIYTHIDGVRLHASLSFTYWHGDYEMPGLIAQQFTEHDWAWLLKAQCGTAYDLEFFPFDAIPMGTAPSALYQCRLVNLTRTQSSDNAYCWECTLEVEGINVVAAADIPVN